MKESKIEEKLKRTEARLNRAAEEKKALKARMKQLEVQAENERLIGHGRLLESFLKEPSRLSEDQIKILLETAFGATVTQRKLEELTKVGNPNDAVVEQPKYFDMWDEIREP